MLKERMKTKICRYLAMMLCCCLLCGTLFGNTATVMAQEQNSEAQGTLTAGEDIKIDFTGNDGDSVSGFTGGYNYWKIVNNTYRPNVNYASTYFTSGVDFDDPKAIHEISFKFMANDSRFRVGFGKTITAGEETEILILHVNSQTDTIELKGATSSNATTYNKNKFVTMGNGVQNCRIVTRDGKATFYINERYHYSYNLPAEADYLRFQMDSNGGYIDDLCITRKNAENHLYLDFETTEDVAEISGMYQTWTDNNTNVVGSIAPKVNYASAFVNRPLKEVQANQTVIAKMKIYVAEESFKVFLANTLTAGDSNIGLTGNLVFDTNGVAYRTSTSDGKQATSQNICSDVLYPGVLDLEMTVCNGKVDFVINGTQYTTQYDLPGTFQYLGWQCGNSRQSYIEMISIDVEDNTFSGSFTGVYNSWRMLNGTYQPRVTYASIRGTHSIVADSKNTISFDVKTGNDFNFALADNLVIDGNLVNGIVMHCYDKDKIVFNNTMSGINNPIATATRSYTGGKVHRITIEIENKQATFFIDEYEIYSCELKYDNYIPVFQMTTENSAGATAIDASDNYIDNYKVKETEEVQVLSSSYEVGDKEVFLGWNVVGGGYNGLYRPGSIVPKSTDIVAEPIVTEFYMTTGASARLASEGGLRWETRIKYSDYEELKSVNTDIKYGTVITSSGSSKQVDIPLVKSGYHSGDDFVWRGALISIKPDNYDRNLLGTGYMKVSYVNGEETTILAKALDNERSYDAVITAAYNDVKDEADGTYKTAVNVNGDVKYTYLSEADFATLTEIYNAIIEWKEDK